MFSKVPPRAMKPNEALLCMSALLCIAICMITQVQANTAVAAKQSYIVYMASGDDDATIAATSITLEERYTATLLKAMQASGDTSVANVDVDDAATSIPLTYVYDSAAVRGFAAPFSTSTAEALRSDTDVLAVVEDGTVDPHTTHTPEFLGLATGKLWATSKKGRDVIVGMIDTGVWPESRSFSDAGMGPVPARWKGVCQVGDRFTKLNCNRKLIGARYFYSGHQAQEGINLTTQVLSARDTQGHGTHTASTAAGAGVASASLNGLGKGHPARGIATQARVAVYKVCWRTCYDSDILAGYDAAVKDGVDVISVSLGAGSRDYLRDSNAVGSFGAVKAGVFVANSAGNDGGYSSTVGNTAPWVMTVAASTVDREFFAGVELGNSLKLRGKSWTPGNWGTAKYPLVLGRNAKAANTSVTTADNCIAKSLKPTLVKGKIVVCRHDGYNSPVEMAQTVLAAGGKGVIVVNLDDETPVSSHYVLPTAVVTNTSGNSILKYIKGTSKPTAVLYPETVLGVKPAPAIAAFSSRGPDPNNPTVLKPDITAPGVNILAAWTENSAPTKLESDPHRVKFNIISGTSMATPHVAGLGALLKGTYPKWSPAAIKSALMTSASVIDNRGARIKDLWYEGDVATPFDYGAGHVVPEKARNPGLVYDITVSDYINFLCAYGYSPATVQVFSGTAVTCPKVPMRAEDLNYPTFSATFKTGMPVAMRFTRTVTNVGPESSEYTVAVKAPAGVKIVVTPNKLRFSKTMHKLSFNVTVSTSGAPERTSGSLKWTAAGGFSVQSSIVLTYAKSD